MNADLYPCHSGASLGAIQLKGSAQLAFSGKTVLIPRASRGIGAATAHHLAALGAKVVLIAQSTQALEQLAADIGP